MSDLKLSAREMEIVSKVFQCFQSPDAMKIDSEKLANLAGFSNGKSANTSWLVIKKKLMSGATFDGTAAATTGKKTKSKAATNGDVDDDEAASTKTGPKKRTKVFKAEPTDAEVGDADTEATPITESPPKKGRPTKTAGPSNINANANAGDAINDTPGTEADGPTFKRKRGPNNPKDPNATPSKRGKKGANAAVVTPAVDDAQTNGEGSIFGGNANKFKKEGGEDDNDDDNDGRPFDAQEQKMRDEALFNLYTAEEDAEGEVP